MTMQKVATYRVCVYGRFDNDLCFESGIGVIFANKPGLVFVLANPEDHEPLGLTYYHLSPRPGEYRVKVNGNYKSPFEIGRNNLSSKALMHLEELIECGIADVPTPACGGYRYVD